MTNDTTPATIGADAALAQLRHLYRNLIEGGVRDTAQAKRIAEGLLAPAIAVLERAALASAAQPASAPAAVAEPVAWLHDDPQRYDVIHAEVKDLLVKSRDAAGHLHRPLDKSAHYTIPLYTAPAPAAQGDALDAARYRWLRRKVSAHGICDGWQFGFPTALTLPAPAEAMRDPAAGLDAAIDAARRAQATLPAVVEPLTDGLLQQHNRDSQELRRLCAERDQARRERDALKAEIAGLESSCSTLGRLVDELRADSERLEWVLRRCAGSWLRAYIGVVSDTSDMDTLRTLIDANRGVQAAHGICVKKGESNGLPT